MLRWLSMVALLALPAGAWAQGGVHVGWDDAPSRGGLANRLFDCNTNAGSNTFVVTFVPTMDLTHVTELKVTLGITMGEVVNCWGGCYPPRLAPWWDLRAGQPRAGALTASSDFSLEPWASSTTVEDPWGGSSLDALPYRVQTTLHPTIDRVDTSEVGLQDVDLLPAAGDPVNLLAGHEYYVIRCTLRNTRTVGGGVCDGCCLPAQVAADLFVASDQSDWTFPIGRSEQPIAWNGWRYGSCPGAATPVRASTWGALKSRYR